MVFATLPDLPHGLFDHRATVRLLREGAMMKCLSLHQPWASLVAYGLKGIETRGRKPTTRYRGPLLIHAAKCWDYDNRKAWDRIRKAFPRNVAAAFPPDEIDDLPLGAVVAAVRVVDVREMTEAWIAEQTTLELEVGDWSPGRFGWVLEGVQRPQIPVPLRGYQGLFNVMPTGSTESFDDAMRLAVLYRAVGGEP